MTIIVFDGKSRQFLNTYVYLGIVFSRKIKHSPARRTTEDICLMNLSRTLQRPS